MSLDLGWDIGTIADFAVTESGRQLLEAKSALDQLQRRVLDNVDGALADATAAYGALRTAVEAVPIRVLDTAAQQISYMISDQLSTIDTSLARAQTAFNYLVDQVTQTNTAAANVQQLQQNVQQQQPVQNRNAMVAREKQRLQIECRHYATGTVQTGTYVRWGPYPDEFTARTALDMIASQFPPYWQIEKWIEGAYYEPPGDPVPKFDAVVRACPPPGVSVPGGQSGTDTGSGGGPSPPQPPPPGPPTNSECSFQDTGPFWTESLAEATLEELRRSCPPDYDFEGHVSPRQVQREDGGFETLYYVSYRCCPKERTEPPTAPTQPSCPPPTVTCPAPVINVTCPGATVTTGTSTGGGPSTTGTSTGGGPPSGDGTKCALPGLQVGCVVVHYEQGSDQKALQAKAETVITALKIQSPGTNYNYTIAQCGNVYALIICKQTRLDGDGCPELYQEGLRYTPKPEYSVTSLPNARDETCWQIAPLGADMWRLLVFSKQLIKDKGWYFDPSWPRD